jgi:hypothetical protein
MSKGSKPRPFSVSHEEFGNRIDGIFGTKPPRQPYVFKPEMLEGQTRMTPEGVKQKFSQGKWINFIETD